MKFAISVILIAVLSFALGLYLPWWSIAIAAFVVTALLHQRPRISLLAGFVALFLLWFFLATVIDMRNQHILSRKLALLLPLGGNSFLLTLITALVGGLVGGLAALSGSFARRTK
jgi:hypothetical protein